MHLVIGSTPASTPIDHRDRALLAFARLTGARTDAVASLRITHVDIAEERVFQDSREVGKNPRKALIRHSSLWAVGRKPPSASGMRTWKRIWDFAPKIHSFRRREQVLAIGSIRTDRILENLLSRRVARAVDVQTYVCLRRPGLFRSAPLRRTLVRLGVALPLGDVTKKAWPQYLGHDDVLVTHRSCGQLPRHKQNELIKVAAHARDDDALALQLGRDMLASISFKKVA